jgi:hypothetical protein
VRHGALRRSQQGTGGCTMYKLINLLQMPVYLTWSSYASSMGSLSQVCNTILPVRACSGGAKELGQ